MEFLGEHKGTGALRNVVQRLDEPQGKLRKLHHGAGHVAEQHQVLLSVALFLVMEPIETAAGLQTLADGAAEIQLAAVAPMFAAGRQLTVDLLGNGLNDGDGLGNFRVPEPGDIPVEDADFRVGGHTAQPGVLHAHLFFQNGFHKNRFDEVVVQLGAPFRRVLEGLPEPAQLFPRFLRHGHIDAALFLRQLHGLAVDFQILPGLLLNLLFPLLLFQMFLGQLAHPLFREEKAVKNPVKEVLFLSGFGVDGPQGRFDLFPVLKAQRYQDFTGVDGFLGADGQPFFPKQPGEPRQLF